MKTKTRTGFFKLAVRVIALLALAALLVFTLAEMCLAVEPTARLISGELSFDEYTAELQTVMTAEAAGKYAFINLNGLYCRITGRNVCNQVMRLENGMLTNLSPERFDMSPAAQGIAQLAQFTEQQGGKLIFALAPAKLDAASELLIPGEVDHSNENGDELLSLLAQSGVDSVDLRDYLTQTPEQVERYFFRTDHHWNYTGAFVGYQKLVETLANAFPNANIDLSLADEANWETHTLEAQMLGSLGKRTGVYFGGLEKVVYYTPRFETHSVCDIPAYSGGSAHYEGSFTQTNIREKYLQPSLDYFEESLYEMYIGGEYNLVCHRSDTAPSDLKLLIVKDSFALPVQAFMSTQFKYIDVIDPRMDGVSVADHIAQTKPDAVLLLFSAGSAGAYPEYSDYGVDATEN